MKSIKTAKTWLSDTFDAETRVTVQTLIDSNSDEPNEISHKNLEFGIGGVRGIMGISMNRINKYTLGKNTQGLGNYLHRSFSNKEIKVTIAHDCHSNSKKFAKIVAGAFAANGIKVFLFSNLRPTPELPFSVRYLGCQADIVLTASHNSPEYNGYRVYRGNGGQTVPPQDGEIMKATDAIGFKNIKLSTNESLIHYIDRELGNAFAEASIKHADFRVVHKENFKIVFTSLHSASITMVPKVLKRTGYTNMYIVEEQAVPDDSFPTVKSPNPEEPRTLTIALKRANELNADIVIDTDPDYDRIGIAVRDLNGKMVLLNGNQTTVMMTDFPLAHQNKRSFEGNEFVVSTIVSTPMVKAIADTYKVEYREGLTGFRWVAKMMKDFPELTFIGGSEESLGYMVGDFVRDKDAVAATLLVCEIAADAKAKGSTLYKELLHAYTKYGFYREYLISLVKKGISGSQEITQMMIGSRENPLKEINGEKVTLIYDYQSSKAFHPLTGKVEEVEIPKLNVLIYHTDKDARIAACPNGTEPKVEFYFSVNTTLNGLATFEETQKVLGSKTKKAVEELEL